MTAPALIRGALEAFKAGESLSSVEAQVIADAVESYLRGEVLVERAQSDRVPLKQMAKDLGVHYETVRRWAQQSGLFEKVGGRFFVNRSEFIAFSRRQEK